MNEYGNEWQNKTKKDSERTETPKRKKTKTKNKKERRRLYKERESIVKAVLNETPRSRLLKKSRKAIDHRVYHHNSKKTKSSRSSSKSKSKHGSHNNNNNINNNNSNNKASRASSKKQRAKSHKSTSSSNVKGAPVVVSRRNTVLSEPTSPFQEEWKQQFSQKKSDRNKRKSGKIKRRKSVRSACLCILCTYH